MLDLRRRNSLDDPLEEDMQVRENDEGRGEAGPGVIFHDQVIALKLPVHITVLLNLIECVTVDTS